MSLKAQLILLIDIFLLLLNFNRIERNIKYFNNILMFQQPERFARQLNNIMCIYHENTNIKASSACKIEISKTEIIIKTSIQDNNY